MHQSEERLQQQDDTTAQDANVEQPRHTTSGGVRSTAPLEGRDLPKRGQLRPEDEDRLDGETLPPEEELPLPPAGMKPNDLIAMPPGSVRAPSSFPGGTPPTDVVVPEPEPEPVPE